MACGRACHEVAERRNATSWATGFLGGKLSPSVMGRARDMAIDSESRSGLSLRKEGQRAAGQPEPELIGKISSSFSDWIR